MEQLGLYMATVMLGLLIHGCLTLPLIYFLLTRSNPLKIVRGSLLALLTAFGTSSRCCIYLYTDDLLTLNNSQIEKSIPNIYPKELELKKTTESQHCSYLDLNITISDLRFTTDLYDKKPFSSG